MSTPLPPKTVADLMAVTGLGRDAVKAAIRTGELPGFYVRSASSSGRGRYVVPAQAFDDFCRGVWVPQRRPVFTEPIRPLPQPGDLVKRRAG
jgi:hypothetical protein